MIKKCLFYISLCLATSQTKAQINYTITTDKFLNFYNKEVPDSIFNLYSSTLKEKLPLERTRSLFSGLHVEFGDLHALDLLKQDSGFNMYKASFTHQTLILLLALSNENLIDGFRLVPYDPEQFPEKKNKDK